MKLSATLQEKIVNFLMLLPNIGDSNTRRALIESAALDTALQSQIFFEGSATQFFQLLVPTLIRYSNLEDGRNALEAVLEAAKTYVGQDRKADCECLLEEFRATGKKEDETSRDIQLLRDSLQGRIDELIGYFEEKAKTVIKDLLPYYKYANVESYLDNFQKLHARHIDCLNKGQLILAHEIMIKIHEISYELESNEISPGYQIKIPGTRYNLGWSNKFQRGKMICAYIVGDMSKDSPAYPKKIGIIAGTKGKLEDLSKVYQIVLARIDKNNK